MFLFYAFKLHNIFALGLLSQKNFVASSVTFFLQITYLAFLKKCVLRGKEGSQRQKDIIENTLAKTCKENLFIIEKAVQKNVRGHLIKWPYLHAV